MDISWQVGETAGKVWHLLNDQGPLTVTQIRKKLNGSADLLNFAIGWLGKIRWRSKRRRRASRSN